MKTAITTAALCLLLPLAAQAVPGHDDTGISGDIQRELSDARREVRTELAKARRDLQTEDLALDGDFRFGEHKPGASTKTLPPAAITAQGDLLIDGKPQPLEPAQRRQLLAYRGLVLEVAGIGIDIGQKSADAALAVVDRSWVSLLFGAMTGSLERRIERTVREEVEPGVRGICRLLPQVMASQQRLSSSLPQFRPYANLEPGDVANCENDVRREFARL